MRRGLWIGGVVGLAIGLWLWMDEAMTRPVGAVLVVRPAPSNAPSGPTAGALGDGGSGSPEPASALASEDGPDAGSRGEAIRFIWRARLPIHDYAGAFQTIRDGGLDADARDAQLLELLDNLIPAPWIATPTFPRSDEIRKLIATSRGADRVLGRWRVANDLVDALAPGAARIGVLTRLELAARAIEEASIATEPIATQLVEVDEDGNPRAAGPIPAAARPTPLLDSEAEAARLRGRVRSELLLVPGDSFLQRMRRQAVASWNLLRTLLATALFAGLGVLLDKYAEAAAIRMGRRLPIRPAEGPGKGEEAPDGSTI